jgi:hypothetical protein
VVVPAYLFSHSEGLLPAQAKAWNIFRVKDLVDMHSFKDPWLSDYKSTLPKRS